MCGDISSKSSDKLEILMDGLAKWPTQAFVNLKEASITWEMLEHPDKIDGTIFAPNLHITWYEK